VLLQFRRLDRLYCSIFGNMSFSDPVHLKEELMEQVRKEKDYQANHQL